MALQFDPPLLTVSQEHAAQQDVTAEEYAQVGALVYTALQISDVTDLKLRDALEASRDLLADRMIERWGQLELLRLRRSRGS